MFRVLFCLCLGALAARGAGEIEDLVGRARAAPPEFAADALIRIAESGRVTDRDDKGELLEEAFRLAAAAQQPLRRTLAIGYGESRATYQALAFDFSLDALSLQTRAVKAILAFDRRKARTLFAEIPPPRFPAPRCEDSLVPHLDDFYEALGDIAERAFTPEQKERNEHVRFMEPYIAAMTSPVQVGLVAEALVRLPLTSQQLEILLSAFSAALESMGGDGGDRAFTYEVSRRLSIHRFEQLLAAGLRHGLPMDGPLMAFRKYLAGHMSLTRCADTSETPREFYREEFNRMLAKYSSAAGEPERMLRVAGIPRIEPNPVPSKIGGAARAEPYWKSAGPVQLQQRIRALRAGLARRSSEVQAAEWQAEVNRVASELAAWSGGGQPGTFAPGVAADEKSEADSFHQKSALFSELVGTLPPGKMRVNVLESYVTFIAQSGMQQESRIEWFYQANSVINRTRTGSAEERAEASALLGKSRNTVLLLYRDLFRELEAPRR